MKEACVESQDVVIIGAGFVGVATAMWLQKSGHKVTLVDPEPFMEGAYFGNACTIATYANIPVGTPSTIKQIPKLLFNPNSPLSINWGYYLGLRRGCCVSLGLASPPRWRILVISWVCC